MGQFSIWHWLVLLLLWAVFGIPAWRITGRTGNHPAWSLLLLLPVANVLFLWWLAFARWPGVRTDP